MEPRKYRNFSLVGTLAALAFIAAVILGIGYWLSGGFSFPMTGGSSSQLTVSGAGIHSIRIDYPRGSVELTPAESSSIVLKEELKADDAEPVTYSAENGTLSIQGDDTFGRRMMHFGGERARLVLEVPADLMADFELLEISTTSGKITAGQIGGERIVFASGSGSIEEVIADAGEISYQTGSGKIQSGSAKGGSVTLLSSSGNIEDIQVEAEELSVKTSSGQIRDFHFSAGRQSLETSSGTIRGGVLESDQVLIRTSSGGIRDLDLTAERAELSTSSGLIDLQMGAVISTIRTNSGKAIITFSEQMTWAGIQTSSGSIEVHAPFDVDIIAGSGMLEQEAGIQGRKTLAVASSSGRIEINGMDMKEIQGDLDWE